MEKGPGALNAFDPTPAMLQQLKRHESAIQARHDALSEREKNTEKRLLEDRAALESKEQALYAQMEHRSRILEERENSVLQKQLDLEKALNKSSYESDKARRALSEEITAKREHLEILIAEAELEKARYSAQSQEAIQKNSGKFVSSALSTLGTKEQNFHTISIIWAVTGALSLVLAVIFAILSMIYSSDDFHQTSSSGLGYYFFHLFRGLLVVGVFAAMSRYAFLFSNSYMHESLKIGERVHAIKFGEFYLDTYGATAEWDQVREAFAHWNISGQSAFSRSEGGTLDVSFTGAAGKLAEKAVDIASKKAAPE
ncbi:hypothetical protein N018_07710 [Pseudomonas syringae CC1557]|uniref:Uncharacterized protein n=1 Tax=Pseudomonas syringae CC1557 TaxID=1357279 RepID=W0N231_PSESX|nr:hypothetical protein [Pseudomonas syringae]AHG43520.1 hypothetical protein N018_07710 [Pseudomonas syringae CC1557]